MGLRGTGSDTFQVEDLFVPHEETIDRDRPDERAEPGTLYRMSTSLAYGVGFSALQLGIARAMLEELRTLARKKTPRGAPSSLLESPVFQNRLAKLEARLRAARAYLHQAADEVQAAAEVREVLTLDDRAALKLATVHVINEAVDVITETYRAAGNTAIFPENGFERRFRDALTASQQVQARDGNYTTIGRTLLGLEPDTTMFL